MKICPICDKKIVGNWCNSCFKFVTPWELSEGIHINERHSQTIDPNCDYHSPKTRFSQQEYMQPGYEEKIYGNASAASRAVVLQRQANAANRSRTVTTTRSTSSSNNVKKKTSLGVKIAIGYVIFILLSAILPIIFSFMDNVEIGSVEPESVPIDYFGDDNYAETDSWYSDSDNETDFDYDVEVNDDYSYLNVLTPVETETEEYGDYKYTYSYYDSNDLKLVGHNCDEEHIDLYYQDLTTMLDMVYPGYSFKYSVDDDYYYNCLEQTDGFSYASFETYVDIEGEDFGIEVSYDSSTEQIHYYLFYADDFNETFMQEVYKWFGFATPGLFESYEEFVECIKEVPANNDLAYREYEEQCVYFVAYDDYVIIDFESIYY